MKEALRLSKPELASTAWEKVEKQIQLRLAVHRKTVENPRQPETDRLGSAWAITELKELLKLAQPAKEQTDAAG